MPFCFKASSPFILSIYVTLIGYAHWPIASNWILQHIMKMDLFMPAEMMQKTWFLSQMNWTNELLLRNDI